MKKIWIVFFSLMSFLVAKEVTVSILPQKYFLEKIAGDKIEVNVMVKPGASPATYEPKTSQMKALSKSLAYFSIGVPFEKAWLEKFKSANKNMLIVDTTMGIQKLPMGEHHHHHESEEAHEDHDHDHGKHEDHNHEEHGHSHEHGALDPHVWLSPVLVKVQARNIYSALVKLDPENKDFYKKNLNIFLDEIKVLDKKIETILKPYSGKAFMIFHPSFGYYALRYKLEQIAVEIEGKEPKPAQLVKLVEEAKEHNIKIVFVSPQFSQKGAKTISKSINGNVATMNPLAIEWDKNLIKVATDIANSYK